MTYEIEKLYQKHGRYEVICDWFRAMAYSIKNALSVEHREAYKKREQEYITMMAKYSQEEQQCFKTAFKQLVDVMDEDVKNGVYKDWLGCYTIEQIIKLGNVGDE